MAKKSNKNTAAAAQAQAPGATVQALKAQNQAEDARSTSSVPRHTVNEEAIFNALDTRNRGYLSTDDLRRALRKHGLQVDKDVRLRNVRNMLDELDRDGLDVDESRFHDLVHKNLVVSTALDGKLVIPRFASFAHEIQKIFEETGSSKHAGGQNAQYIPQLARVDPDQYGVAVCTIDGQIYSVGDKNIPFCVQSCSKPITYCMALEQHGEDKVHQHIGREPSGRNFNEMALDDLSRPHNPMINSGAIMACSLVKETEPVADRFDYVTKVWTKLSGERHVSFNNSVYLSERASANRNFCLGYMMQEKDSFPTGTDLVTTLEFYFMCCSVELDCEAMSVIAATLANGGLCPTTGVRVFAPETVRNCLSLMFSCGMYDYSGEFAFSMGFPAKSGVAGSLMIVIPGVMGICTWSPRLDKFGNSVRGVEFCRLLGERFPFHNFGGLQTPNYVADAEGKDKKVQVTRSDKDESADSLTALLWAARDGDLWTCQRMVARGIPLDDADYDGRTALHVAASNGQLAVVRFLLNMGASTDVLDRYGARPADDSKRKGFTSVTSALEQAGSTTRNVMDGAPTDPFQRSTWMAYKSMDTKCEGRVTTKVFRSCLTKCGFSLQHKAIISVLQPREDDDMPSEVSFSQFAQIVAAAPFVLRGLRGELIVPDFEMFSDDVLKCYAAAEPNKGGANAAYIPQLKVVDPEQFGVAVCTVDGQEFKHGETEVDFCIQSCSKVITYAIVQEAYGESKVHQHVGREASGRRFNEVAFDHKGRPHNPCINSGAIMCASMLPGNDQAERYDRMRDVWGKLTGGTQPRFSNPTYLSELSTADRNFALAYLMRELGAFPKEADLGRPCDDPDKVVDILDSLKTYFSACSLLLNAEELSRVAATLANGGVCPSTRERVFSERTVRNALSLMFSCGMYDFSGEFAFTMGFPCKSGVAGALMIVIPGVMGICTFSPRLDKLGNSVRGNDFCRHLGGMYNLHNYDHLPGVVSAGIKKNPLRLRGNDDEKLQADVTYAAAGGDVRSLNRLHNMGVPLERGDYDGRTPLHLAAAEGHVKVVEYLLSKGVNAAPLDQWGATPAEEAKLHGHNAIAAMLNDQASK